MFKKISALTISALLGIGLLAAAPAYADNTSKQIGDCEVSQWSAYCDGPNTSGIKNNKTILDAYFKNSLIDVELYKTFPSLVQLSVSGGANTDLRPLMALDNVEHFTFNLDTGVNKVRLGSEFTVPTFLGFDGKKVEYKTWAAVSTRNLTTKTGFNKFKGHSQGEDYFLETQYFGSQVNGGHRFNWQYELNEAGSVLVQDDILPRPGAGLVVTSSHPGVKPASKTVPLGTDVYLAADVPSKVFNGTSCIWYRDGVRVKDVSRGHTLSDCYRPLTKNDSGKTLKAVVTYHAWHGWENTVLKNTATYQTKLTVLDVFKPRAKIIGTNKVGTTLKAVPSNTPKGTSYTYQWLRNGKTIRGATRASYPLVAADLSQRISVKATAKKAGYFTETVIAAQTGKIAKGALKNTKSPTVAGRHQVGKILKVNPGSWSAKPDKYTYQWYRSGAAISKATKSSYKFTTRDKGKVIYVKVTAHKKGFTSKSANSKVK